MAQGINNYSRSDLHFCLENTSNNQKEVTISDSLMTIKHSGNVGIGLSNPSEKLEVNGTVKATTFSGALSGNATTATTASYVTNGVYTNSTQNIGGYKTFSNDMTINAALTLSKNYNHVDNGSNVVFNSIGHPLSLSDDNNCSWKFFFYSTGDLGLISSSIFSKVFFLKLVQVYII